MYSAGGHTGTYRPRNKLPLLAFHSYTATPTGRTGGGGLQGGDPGCLDRAGPHGAGWLWTGLDRPEGLRTEAGE